MKRRLQWNGTSFNMPLNGHNYPNFVHYYTYFLTKVWLLWAKIRVETQMMSY